MKKALTYTLIGIVIVFALIGMAFSAVFVGMQLGITNVRGTIEERNSFFGTVPRIDTITNNPSTDGVSSESAGSDCLGETDPNKPCEWYQTVQWAVVEGGLQKDQAVIERVANETGVSARMIAAAVMPEQMRFFAEDGNREVFKRYFEPLKILASLSQFSLGVSGMKQKTAEQVEQYANDPNAPFYPGPEYAPLLAYSTSTTDTATELFNRLTDEKDHYYSYLYTAIYLKQIEAQWKQAGYDVGRRPDVLVTLFNLGFAASEPKPNPQVAGAPIIIGGQRYSFGDLGATFYHSDELITEFQK